MESAEASVADGAVTAQGVTDVARNAGDVEKATGGSGTAAAEVVAEDPKPTHEELLRSHDLTEKLALYWDPQMLFYVLKWLKAKKRYPEAEINSAMVKALCDTFLADEWQNFQKERPAEHIAAQDKQSEKRQQLDKYLETFVRCMTELRKEKKRNSAAFPERRTYKEWSAWYQKRMLDSGEITPGTTVVIQEDCSEKLLEYARMHYVNGLYERSLNWLSFFVDYICKLTPVGLNFDCMQTAYWGLAASLILSLPPPWQTSPTGTPLSVDHSSSAGPTAAAPVAAELPHTTPEQDDAASQLAQLLVELDKFFEDNSSSELVPVSLNLESSDASLLHRVGIGMSPVEALEHNKTKKEELLIRRVWVLHWSLWPIFRYYIPRLFVGGRAAFSRYAVWSSLLDWFFHERNLFTVLISCPHLLRYYAVLAILNRRSDYFQLVCETVGTASQSGKYSDPFTSLLEALFVDFDFDRAQKTLSECSIAAEADFFIAPLQPFVEEHARLLIFETYCRIHKAINIDMIAKKLNMTSGIAEKWIVNLIRHAKLDAKIDSERNRVEITTEPPNIYQQVLENTRDVGKKSHMLIQNLDKPAGGDRGDVGRRGGGGGYRGGFGNAVGRGGGGRSRNWVL